VIGIPFENGKALPGYFVKASETMEPHATAIVIGALWRAGERSAVQSATGQASLPFCWAHETSS
jgi:hypothetical protein